MCVLWLPVEEDEKMYVYMRTLVFLGGLFIVSYMGYPVIDNWSAKAKRRRTLGTGRRRFIKYIPRRAKNKFREGTVAPERKRGKKA